MSVIRTTGWSQAAIRTWKGLKSDGHVGSGMNSMISVCGTHGTCIKDQKEKSCEIKKTFQHREAQLRDARNNADMKTHA
mgnify:CR=1 FL=1